MEQKLYCITSHTALVPNVYKLTLEGNMATEIRPGQFVNIKIEGLYLRRPISICDADGDRITLIYKVVGSGTTRLSRMAPGEWLDILVPLGNGFSLDEAGERPLLIGGGVGIPPMFLLCRRLSETGRHPQVILGFNSADDAFYEDEFLRLGADVAVTTVDGSYGVHGYVTSAMPETDYSYVYACGPEPMLRAVYDASKTSGQFSFEERMGCGFGACMGCSCKTKYGYKRICRDGPVLTKEEIVW